MKDIIKRLLKSFGMLGSVQRVACRIRACNLGLVLEFKDSHMTVRKGKREIRINPKHEIYLWDMINYFDYYHDAVFPSTENGVELVDYSCPILHRLRRSGIEFEFPSLPESDESTEVYMRALNLMPGDVVLDFGAYAGASAYFLAKAVGPDGIVLSFEPDKTNFHSLWV